MKSGVLQRCYHGLHRVQLCPRGSEGGFAVQLGSWCFPRTVFRAIVEETENLYVLTSHIWGKPIVSNYFLRDDDRLREFEMLLLPTNTKLDEFYRQLEIITVGNLNKDFFVWTNLDLTYFHTPRMAIIK